MLGVFNCVFDHLEAAGSRFQALAFFLLQFFETISTEDRIEMGGVLFKVINKVVLACLTCVLTLGGAMVGIIMGAIKGQTTETGLVCGAGVGALAGAITVVQLMDLMVNGEPFSKVALLSSLANGNVFVEWVCPAVLKAYQWQISTMETSFRDISDIFQVNATNGLSQDCIKNLPKYKFYPSDSLDINCSICLQDFKNGEAGRRLPSCAHSFHLQCIDEWLTRHASCPVCRREF